VEELDGTRAGVVAWLPAAMALARLVWLGVLLAVVGAGAVAVVGVAVAVEVVGALATGVEALVVVVVEEAVGDVVGPARPVLAPLEVAVVAVGAKVAVPVAPKLGSLPVAAPAVLEEAARISCRAWVPAAATWLRVAWVAGDNPESVVAMGGSQPDKV
jgi:hypothetical protein